MNFYLVFFLSSYLLVFLGLAGLFLTEELSSPYLLLAAACLVLGALGEARTRKGFLPEIAANIAMLAVFVLTLFPIFVLQAPPLQELVHFLLALQAVKLLAPKKGRDWLQLYLLSFFSLLAAAALSVEVSFAAIFVCYLFAAPWVLVLFHLKTATESAGKIPDLESRLLSWSLFRLVGGLNVILLLLTLFFFVSFPRMGTGFFGNSWATGSAVTGFSDHLALGEVAEIQKNNAVAMRVSIEPRVPQRGEFYWRGVALDFFDGRKWRKSSSDTTPLKRRGESYLVGEPVSNTALLVRQRITLEPSGSAAFFTLSGPVAVSGRIPYVFQDSLGNLQSAFPLPFQISYEVLSHPEAGRQGGIPTSNALQLPATDSRIIQLSHRVADGTNDEVKKARALERYLRETYRYSLTDLPVGEGDPLAVFLFDIRQGNCEYFASSLAVMLRSLGIPSRVVNGYLGGEWNPYGEYYLIRQSNAHSWVEAYFADRGWVTLDPTPPVPRPSGSDLFSSFTHLVDFLRMRWYRHVINFSFGDQYQIFTAIKRPDIWFGSGLRHFSLTELRKWLPAFTSSWIGLPLLLGCLALGWHWLKKIKSGKKAYARNLTFQATERYQRLLALLRKKNLIKKAGETADEFSQRAEGGGIGLVKEFTGLYQQARFSGRRDFSDGLNKMDQILLQLRQ